MYEGEYYAHPWRKYRIMEKTETQYIIYKQLKTKKYYL